MKRAIRLTFPIAAAVMLASCGLSPEEHFSRGEKALAGHRYNAARIDFLEVLQAEPDHAPAMDRLVQIYLAQGNAIAAKGMLDRMARDGRLSDEAPVYYGEAALLGDRFDEALDRVDTLRSAESYRIRALSYLGKGEPERAEEAFAVGRGAPGVNGRLLAAYARYMMGKNELAAARGLAERAARSKPVGQDALIVNAEIAQAQDRNADALEWYDRTLKLYPESRSALLGKIESLGRMGRTDEVRPLVADARKHYPGDPGFIYYEALLAAQDNDWSRVRDLLQPLETVLDGLPLANMLYAKSMLELGHGEQARIRLASQLLREPENRQARLLLAQTQLAVGDTQGAAATLQPVAGREDATREELALVAKVEQAADGT